MGLLRTISSTCGSAGRVCHVLMYSGFLTANPANSRLGCRIGQYPKYSTSALNGHDDLFWMYGNIQAIVLPKPLPSGSPKAKRLSCAALSVWQMAASPLMLKRQ